jgi:hypothetical protein
MMNKGDVETATITLYDEAGNSVVHQGKAKFTFGKTRISSWAAANQRELIALVKDNPKAVKATIGNIGWVSTFKIVDGYPQWVR